MLSGAVGMLSGLLSGLSGAVGLLSGAVGCAVGLLSVGQQSGAVGCCRVLSCWYHVRPMSGAVLAVLAKSERADPGWDGMGKHHQSLI